MAHIHHDRYTTTGDKIVLHDVVSDRDFLTYDCSIDVAVKHLRLVQFWNWSTAEEQFKHSEILIKNCTVKAKFHYAIKLASRSQTSSRSR